MRVAGFACFPGGNAQVESQHRYSPQGQVLQKSFQRRAVEKPLALLVASCFRLEKKKKTNGTLHVRTLPKTLHIGPNPSCVLPVFVCLCWLARQVVYIPSCNDDTPNLFETTFSTRKEIPEMSVGFNCRSRL